MAKIKVKLSCGTLKGRDETLLDVLCHYHIVEEYYRKNGLKEIANAVKKDAVAIYDALEANGYFEDVL